MEASRVWISRPNELREITPFVSGWPEANKADVFVQMHAMARRGFHIDELDRMAHKLWVKEFEEMLAALPRKRTIGGISRRPRA